MVTIILEGFFMVAVAALLFGRFCFGSFVFHFCVDVPTLPSTLFRGLLTPGPALAALASGSLVRLDTPLAVYHCDKAIEKSEFSTKIRAAYLR